MPHRGRRILALPPSRFYRLPRRARAIRAHTGVARAGCGNTVTPFDGDYEAGIQALSTRNFAALNGPLGRIN